MIPIARPDFGPEETNAVAEVLASGMVAQGKRVAELEQDWAEFVGVKHAIAMSNGTLALMSIFAGIGLEPGDDVLVHAAGSGVGSAAVQIARLFRARVIATAGSDRKLEQARALGADHVINYETRDWVAEVRNLTGKRGVDIVFEHVGEKTFPGSLKVLAKGTVTKALTVRAHKFSAKAQEQITGAGGKAEILEG